MISSSGLCYCKYDWVALQLAFKAVAGRKRQGTLRKIRKVVLNQNDIFYPGIHPMQLSKNRG
jgi:hypothetical protein